MTKMIFPTICVFFLSSCNNVPNSGAEGAGPDFNAPGLSGQSVFQDPVFQKNVVQVAMSSNDHTTLVKAIQAAGLVDALSNAGPFTVFAPTNTAFGKLPSGTLDGLLQPEKKSDLEDVLQYHVSLGGYHAGQLQDGQSLDQVNGGNITISIKDGKTVVNGKANVVASIPASNGIIHVIDAVLLPPTAK